MTVFLKLLSAPSIIALITALVMSMHCAFRSYFNVIYTHMHSREKSVQSVSTLIGTPVHLHVHRIIQFCNRKLASQCVKSCTCRSRALVDVCIKHQNTGDLCEFDCGRVGQRKMAKTGLGGNLAWFQRSSFCICTI